MAFFQKYQIDQIISFAFEAGKIAVDFQKSRDFTIHDKPDNSKVTSADIAISQFLNQKLSQEFSQIPIICEEGVLRNLTSDTFWLIDPIDGTSSFIKGSDQFAINIALIQQGNPVFGLVYAPRFDGGKMAVSNDKDQVIIINEAREIQYIEPKKININAQNPLRIVTSTKTQNDELNSYLQQFHPQHINNFTITYLASAVKFFSILENKADLYVSFRRLMEWDTAAGQALIQLIDGKLKNLTLQNSLYVIGDDLRYGKPNFVNEFFACYK